MSAADDLTVSELRQRVRSFMEARDWEQFHSPKHLSMSIAIEAAELMECFQWQTAVAVTQELQQNGPPADAVDELADVLIYCLSMANALNIQDLGQAILDKLERSGRKYPADQFRGRFK